MTEAKLFSINKITFDPEVYPRAKWSTATIERYADAMAAGAKFPPMVLEKVVDEEGEAVYRLLDGKHRLESYKKAEISEAPVLFATVPEGMSAKYYAATLSARHGDRLSNSDLRELAEAEFEADPSIGVQEWGRGLGVSERSVYRWVSHILERERTSRAAKAWRLAMLGWTQEEIGARLGVDRSLVSLGVKNCHLAKIHKDLGEHWNEKGVEEVATRLNLPMVDAMAAAMQGMNDLARLDRLNIGIRPYDVWNFAKCHKLMGAAHPGRIPGELVCHALYFFTKPGAVVVDPMAGSGTVLDACLLMGRKARGYDIDERHERVDIEKHNLADGWPAKTAKANLIFWDPPYYDKMDKSTIGEDGYVAGSISGLPPDEYIGWLAARFRELYATAKPGAVLAFLMSDWDPEKAKQYKDHKGLFLWDYAREIEAAGWTLVRQIQAPLPTQQLHPDLINKFRDRRRLGRLGRSLLVAKK